MSCDANTIPDHCSATLSAGRPVCQQRIQPDVTLGFADRIACQIKQFQLEWYREILDKDQQDISYQAANTTFR
jgi:hypothetical protein